MTTNTVQGYEEEFYELSGDEKLLATNEILIEELERQSELEESEEIILDEFITRSLEIGFNTTTEELNYEYTISEVKRLEDLE